MRILLTLALVVPVCGASGVVPTARAQAPATPVQAPSLPGPLESRAVPTGADNPVPTRTRTVAAEYPEARRKPGVRGTVTLRITIDEAGRVAEARRPFNPDFSVVQIEGSRYGIGSPLGQEFVDAAVRAVRDWRYDPPRQAPIALFVRLLFSPSEPTTITWHDAARPPNPNGANVPGGVPGGVVAGPAPPLPPPPPPGTPVRVGGNITPPKRIKDVPPVYPPVAQSARVEGIVILEATIGRDGRVADVRVLRSIPLLDQAAIDAVRQWEFTPTMMNGVPTAVIMSVTINFTLGERGGAPAAPGNTAPPPP